MVSILNFLREVWAQSGAPILKEEEAWVKFNAIEDKGGVSPPHEDLDMGLENPVVVAIRPGPAFLNDNYPVLSGHSKELIVSCSDKYPEVYRNLAGRGMPSRSWAGLFFKENGAYVFSPPKEIDHTLLAEKEGEYKGGFGLIFISQDENKLEQLIKKIPAIMKSDCQPRDLVVLAEKTIMIMVKFV